MQNLLEVKKLVVQIRYVLTPQQKIKAMGVAMVILFGSLLELLGVTAVMPFIQAMLEPDKLRNNVLFQHMFSLLQINSSRNMVWVCGILLVFLYLFKNGFILFSTYVQADYSTRTQKELSTRMLVSYMSQPYIFFTSVNSADILRGIRDDTVCVYNIVSNLFSLFTEMVTVFLIALYIMVADTFMAIGTLAVAGMAMILMVSAMKPRMKNAGEKNRVAILNKNKSIFQAVSGIKEIFVLQRRDNFIEQYKKAAELGRKTQRTYDFLIASPERMIEGICVSGMIVVVCIRLGLWEEPSAFVPKLATFAMAGFKILPSVGKITNRIAGIIFNRSGLQNVYDVLKDAEKTDKNMIASPQAETASLEVDFKESIKIHKVSWKYPENQKNILEEAELAIQKGESIALIGASGAGKTTVADILLGLLQPKKGNVLLDDKEISEIQMRGQWSKVIGYVPQTVFLTDDTIRRNIAFGMDDVEIDDKKVWDALRQAQLTEFIETLPKKLDTIVGERGIRFSGGQRQRIAIARALYNDPEILVLDEATSALDSETEKAIMDSMEALYGKKTLIIVAHRLTTIKNCDKIYEVADGNITLREKREIFG